VRRVRLTRAVASWGFAVGLVAVPVTSASAAPATHSYVEHHRCTRTSSGTCIQGGEFCKQSEYGQKGYDANGRKYICKGSRVHPHWEKP
jgi:hypothetical protein